MDALRKLISRLEPNELEGTAGDREVVSCRRCGCVVDDGTYPAYCDSCFFTGAKEIILGLAAKIDGREPGWAASASELVGAFDRASCPDEALSVLEVLADDGPTPPVRDAARQALDLRRRKLS